MKKLLFSIILLISINSYSQSLGWNYNDCLKAIKNDSKYTELQKKYIKKSNFYIIAFCDLNKTNELSNNFYFTADSICKLLVVVYDISYINVLIDQFNKEYVKISELKWKDYKTDLYFEITKIENFCNIRMYK